MPLAWVEEALAAILKSMDLLSDGFLVSMSNAGLLVDVLLSTVLYSGRPL